jgi:hypothetical protein
LTADPPLRLPFADDQVMAGEVGVVPAFAPFGPESLVDRRTDPFSEWLGAFDNSVPSSVTLEWSVPISAREVVVHGPRPGQGPATNGGLFGPRDQQILGFTVITTLRGSLAQEIPVRQTIQTAAPPVRVAVPLDPSRPFDALRLTIRPEDVRGQFELGRGPALSEVEVVARAVEPAPEPTYRFQRGDSNCDGRLDLTDAVAVLDRLFLGGKRLCCEAAADADGNRDVNLTDPVVVLNFLFLGGKPPAFPSGVCDRAPAAGLTCDIEVCSP